jgi:dihydroflavonol-4-reductase
MEGMALVTGSSGFIGSAVVRHLLARGRRVRCYVEPGVPLANLEGLDVEIVRGDILDQDALTEAARGCAALYHLAAIYKLWMPEPEKFYRVNVGGTACALEAARRAGVARVVHTSSIAAVGLPAQGDLADETHRFNLWNRSDDYVRSKWLSEMVAVQHARAGQHVVIVNPAFPFGERDAAPTPTGGFVVEFLRRRVPGYMDGGFCVIDVEDVAEAHVRAEERGRPGERYILGAHNVTYKQFFDAVAAAAGMPPLRRRYPAWLVKLIARWSEFVSNRFTHRHPLVTVKSIEWSARRVWYDTRKMREELGIAPAPLEETLSRAVKWYRDHGYDRVTHNRAPPAKSLPTSSDIVHSPASTRR